MTKFALVGIVVTAALVSATSALAFERFTDAEMTTLEQLASSGDGCAHGKYGYYIYKMHHARSNIIEGFRKEVEIYCNPVQAEQSGYEDTGAELLGSFLTGFVGGMASGVGNGGMHRNGFSGSGYHAPAQRVGSGQRFQVQGATIHPTASSVNTIRPSLNNTGASAVSRASQPVAVRPVASSAGVPISSTALAGSSKTAQSALPTPPKSTAGCAGFHAQLVQIAPYYSPDSFNYAQYQQTVAQYNSLCGG